MKHFIPYRDFWVPQYKYQFLSWLRKQYPKDNWSWKTKNQLKGAYIGIRGRLG